jgi:ubiquinone/menaquinone biosynthesis C-methylase UbiE
MKKDSSSDDLEVKRANIQHHDAEANFFERAHPEGSSVYERRKVSKSIASIVKNSQTRNICVDVGCGTGFVTGFELPFYNRVIATDISRRMLEVARKRFGHYRSLDLVVCDAEFLPLRSQIADLVSISSVLHHLPRPYDSLRQISRTLKQNGFLYVTREPNFQRFRRFFDFLDYAVIQKWLKSLQRLRALRPEGTDGNVRDDRLDYSKVDVHYSTGFHSAQLSEFLRSEHFEVVSAYSYHWIFPDSDDGALQLWLSKSNFLVEKIPASSKLGRYVSIIARKKVEEN